MILHTNDNTFEDDVLKSEITIMVDFWAPWCGPCRMLGPIMENISKKVTNIAKVYKLNIDENRETAIKYGIVSIPTVIIFKNGQIYKKFIGIQPQNVYIEAVLN